jgi:hypothetical protein
MDFDINIKMKILIRVSLKMRDKIVQKNGGDKIRSLFFSDRELLLL